MVPNESNLLKPTEVPNDDSISGDLIIFLPDQSAQHSGLTEALQHTLEEKTAEFTSMSVIIASVSNQSDLLSAVHIPGVVNPDVADSDQSFRHSEPMDGTEQDWMSSMHLDESNISHTSLVSNSLGSNDQDDGNGQNIVNI